MAIMKHGMLDDTSWALYFAMLGYCYVGGNTIGYLLQRRSLLAKAYVRLRTM